MKKQSLMMLAATTVLVSNPLNMENEIDDILRRARNRKPKERQRTVSDDRKKGSIRNLPCECGSGIKYKKCCYLATGE